jgi:hypothetical protein
VNRDDAYEAFRARIPEQFHTCPAHGGLFVSVVDETMANVVDGLWKWAAPQFVMTFGCCEGRLFRVSMRRLYNPKHPSYRAHGVPLDPGEDEMRVIAGDPAR